MATGVPWREPGVSLNTATGRPLTSVVNAPIPTRGVGQGGLASPRDVYTDGGTGSGNRARDPSKSPRGRGDVAAQPQNLGFVLGDSGEFYDGGTGGDLAARVPPSANRGNTAGTTYASKYQVEELTRIIVRLNSQVFNWSEDQKPHQRRRLAELLLRIVGPSRSFNSSLAESANSLEDSIRKLQGGQSRVAITGVGTADAAVQTKRDRGDKVFRDQATGIGEALDIDDPPPVLEVAAPKCEEDIGGVYELVDGAKPGGYPLWKHNKSDYWIYSGTDGQWFIGDKDEYDQGFQADTGLVASLHAHGGTMPHLINGAGGGWQLYKDQGGVWVLDTTINIISSEPDGAAPGKKALSPSRANVADPSDAQKLRDAWDQVATAREEVAKVAKERDKLKAQLLQASFNTGPSSDTFVLGGDPNTVGMSSLAGDGAGTNALGVPQQLIFTGSKVSAVNGTYELVLGADVNGHPAWKKKDDNYWCYSSPEENWCVGDEEDFQEGNSPQSGIVRTSYDHGGNSPDTTLEGSWIYYREKDSQWVNDKKLVIKRGSVVPDDRVSLLDKEIEARRETLRALKAEEDAQRKVLIANRQRLREESATRIKAVATVEENLNQRLQQVRGDLSQSRRDLQVALRRAEEAERKVASLSAAQSRSFSPEPAASFQNPSALQSPLGSPQSQAGSRRKQPENFEVGPDVSTKRELARMAGELEQMAERTRKVEAEVIGKSPRRDGPPEKVWLKPEGGLESYAGEFTLKMSGNVTGKAVYRSSNPDRELYLVRNSPVDWVIKRTPIGGDVIASVPKEALSYDGDQARVVKKEGSPDGAAAASPKAGGGAAKIPAGGTAAGSPKSGAAKTQDPAKAGAAGPGPFDVQEGVAAGAARAGANVDAQPSSPSSPVGVVTNVGQQAPPPEAPLSLVLRTPKWEKTCRGTYTLVDDELVDEMPVWEHESVPGLRLFSDTGQWIIGIPHEIEEETQEFLSSVEPHGFFLPHKLTGGWNIYREGKGWGVDPKVTVTLATVT